jgi:hypothetical protein
MINADARSLRSKWPMPSDRHKCTRFTIDLADAQAPMIDTEARSLRWKWPMPNDRHKHTHFTIDKADSQSSTLMHAFAIEVADAQ